MECMQAALQEKFAFRNLEDGMKVKIIFRLPGAEKVEHHFLAEESVMVNSIYKLAVYL